MMMYQLSLSEVIALPVCDRCKPFESRFLLFNDNNPIDSETYL